MPKHGTMRRYWRGCRCLPCRAACSVYRQTPHDGLVPAEPVCRQLELFPTQREAARATLVSRATIARILNGRTKQVSLRVARQIQKAKYTPPPPKPEPEFSLLPIIQRMGSIARAARLTGLHRNTIWKFRCGITAQLRPETERKILNAIEL